MSSQNFLSTRSPLFKFLFLGLGYFFLSQISHLFAFHYGLISIIWLATGFALGVLLLTGYRFWPAITIATFLGDFSTSHEMLSSAAGAISSTATCLFAYFMLQKAGFNLQMKRLSDVLVFTVLAAIIAPFCGATLAVTTICLQHGSSWYDFASAFFTWWIGDTIGIIIMGPFILLLRQDYFKNWSPARFLEWMFIHVSLVISLVTFFYILGQKAHHDYYPLAYLPLPFLIWSTVRFGQQGATFANLLIATCTLYCAFGRFAHFGEDLFGDSLPMAWVFIGMLSIASLILASSLQERKTTAIYNRQKIYFFRQIIDALPTPICVKDEEGNPILTNRSWSLWDSTSPKVSHKKKRFPSQKSPDLPTEIGLTTEIPFEIAKRKGIALHIQKRIPVDTEQNVICLEQLQDITSLKKTQEVLKQAKSQLKAALITANLGLWHLNVKTAILQTDYNWSQLTGILSNHCLLSEFEAGIFSKDKEHYYTALKQTLCDETIPFLSEFSYQRPDGTTLWLRMKGHRIANEETSSLHLAGILCDISTQKKLELSLQKEKEITENTHLSKSVFMTNVANEANKGAYNLHLNVEKFIASFINPLSTKQRQAAAHLQKNTNFLTELMGNVHEFSLLETGKWILQQKTFTIHHLVKETVERAKIKAYNKDIKFHYFIDPTIPMKITADESHLRQILDNLFSNAIKSIRGKGNIDLTLKIAEPSTILEKLTFSEDSGQKILHFSLRDTGIGISQERLPSLFDASAQVDPKNITRYGINSLGLPLCKRFAEQMGGTIWVETEKEIGSTFHVLFCTLPVCETIQTV